MSIRATNFVRRLRGLTPTEKLVAFVLADHDNHKGGGIFCSMDTVADETGLADRQYASILTRRLRDRKIIVTNKPSKGRHPTLYHFNYELEDCDPSVSVAPVNRILGYAVDSQGTAYPDMPLTAHSGESNRVQNPPGSDPTAYKKASNRILGYAARVVREKKERETQEEGEEGSLCSPAAPAAAPAPKVEVLRFSPEQTADAFDAIKQVPFGSQEHQELWTEIWTTNHDAEKPLSALLEEFLLRAKPKPWPKWYMLKHRIEDIEIKNAHHEESFQERKNRRSKEALERARRNCGDYFSGSQPSVPTCDLCRPDGWIRNQQGQMVRCKHPSGMIEKEKENKS
jgi:hypothetical protein